MVKAFSLMEVLISLAIIGILSAIAIPMYQQHIALTHRADGQVALLTLASALENYYLRQHTYQRANFATLQQSERSPEGFYRLNIVLENDGQSYLLQAIPLDKQAKMDAACGTLELTTDGRRTFIGNDPKHHCW